ncbi:MAG: hypothetical protein ACR2HR_09340 [Euzebya sp.]
MSAIAVAGLATSPLRPTGVSVAVAILVLLLPLCGLIGAWLGLRVGQQPDRRTAGMLAAPAAPVLTLTILFLLHTAGIPRNPGAVQLTALVAGVVSAAALGARFSGRIDDDDR